MEKVKHYSKYSDKPLKDYAEFVKLAGFMDFQNLLWHRVPVCKGYPSRKERFIIESFYYDEKPELNPKFTASLFEIFKFLQDEVETTKFYNNLSEQDIVNFIKEIRSKNYFKGLKFVSKVSDLTEKEAAMIISCTFYEWVATGEYKRVGNTAKEMIFEHKFYDIKNGKIKSNIPRKPTKAELDREYPTK